MRDPSRIHEKDCTSRSLFIPRSVSMGLKGFQRGWCCWPIIEDEKRRIRCLRRRHKGLTCIVAASTVFSSAFLSMSTHVSVPLPFASVIIPVRNRSEMLRHCLTAVSRQSYPRDCFEIIVVDNHSDEKIEDVCSPFAPVRLLRSNEGGSYSARNVGIKSARGTIIAFTDSDCMPRQDWLQRGVDALLKGNADIIAGAIRFTPPAGGDLNVYEALEESYFNMANQRRSVENRFGATANLFTRRIAFEIVGGFNNQMMSGGDKEWCFRAFERGLKISYCENTLVWHPRRSTLRDLTLLIRRGAGGQQDLLMRRGRVWTAIWHFFRDFPLSPCIPVLGFSCSKVLGFRKRMIATCVLFFISIVATFERIKVVCGGRVFRGD